MTMYPAVVMDYCELNLLCIPRSGIRILSVSRSCSPGESLNEQVEAFLSSNDAVTRFVFQISNFGCLSESPVSRLFNVFQSMHWKIMLSRNGIDLIFELV